ncbi:MAG: trypsin-like peptidase domain-containing protein [Clostridia bacterium]|nr:trypsin-like peptidase domain-containing protein [Clostridia bacterium]
MGENMENKTDIFGPVAGDDAVEILSDAPVRPAAEDNAKKSAGKDFSKNYKILSDADAASLSGKRVGELASSQAYRNKAARRKKKIVTAVVCVCLIAAGCVGGYLAAAHMLAKRYPAPTDAATAPTQPTADLSFFLEQGATVPSAPAMTSAAENVGGTLASTTAAPTETASETFLSTAFFSLPELPELSDFTLTTRVADTPISAPSPIANTDTPQQTQLNKKDIYSENVSTVVGVTATINIENPLLSQSYVSESKGSGFIVSSSGVVLTNYHIVKNSTNIEISLYDGSRRAAQMIGYDDSNDLAVLRADVAGFKAVKTGSSARLAVGDEVLIIGNPLGTLDYSLTNGVISATDRLIANDAEALRMFQTNAPVNSGNSGGPVFNMNGEVVGIVTGKYAESSIEGLSFCIPIDNVLQSIVEIVKFGSPQNKPTLAVSVQTLTKQTTEQFGLTQGAYIVDLDENGAAARAGLQKEDVITGFNGETITSVADLRTQLLKCRAGQQVSVTVFRSGESVETTLTTDVKTPRASRTGYANVYDL